MYKDYTVALIVPCFNEEATVGQVVNDFLKALEGIEVYVFDNQSTDRTAQVARDAGAEVVTVSLRGKGNVVRRMFADVEADIYVMVDGDSTYDASAVVSLVEKLINERLDMVVGCREVEIETQGREYRSGHQLGNKLLTQSVVRIFGGGFSDMLYGYRVFSRRYVKSFHAISHGFETETELTVHALELRMPYGEITTLYGARPEGSASKLSTYRDGWRILKTIIRLYITERPFSFFGYCALLMAALSVVIAFPLFEEFLTTGLVPRLPTAVLSASLMISALLSFFSGLILDSVTRGRHEMKRLAYLGIDAPGGSRRHGR
jgi:glycosyltransferase involved in cell wall biosynthesis